MALALLAGTGLALFGWINQNLRTASRAQDDARAANVRLAAQAYINTVNPVERPEGEATLVPGWTVSWQSELVEAPRTNTVFSAEGIGPWRVSLHRLSVRVRDVGTGTEVRFNQLRPGLQRTQPAEGATP